MLEPSAQMGAAMNALRIILGGLLALAAGGVGAQNPVDEQRLQALTRAQAAVVGVETTAVDGARSAETLGSERRGSGVLIDADGLVLTIGYLILEADQVDIVVAGQRRLPARVVAYDLATGFGLLQSLAPVRVTPVPLGRSGNLRASEPLMVASGGEDGAVSIARLVSARAFSGYWEYHIDGALFTAPPRPDHSGAGLFNVDGELMGIGSLFVQDAAGADAPRQQGNMFVPIDLLKPILGELRERGMSQASRRAWLGVNCVEHGGVVRVVRVNRDSPAEAAGLAPGDRIMRIDGVEVTSLEVFYKSLWRDGAERDVKLEVQRGGTAREVTVRSTDRAQTLRRPQGI
jgi:S1-C subfamily serine protease